MRHLLLLLLLGCCGFNTIAETQNITVLNVYSECELYNDNVTYNVVAFDYEPNLDPMELPLGDYTASQKTVKIGITTTNNALVDVIWEYQSLSMPEASSFIQSIELVDLNHDQLMDIIINYSDVDGDFPDQIISSFLINQNPFFEEISETFIKARYEITEEYHIKNESPLSMFGRPYIEEEPQKEMNYWVDYYEFQGKKLVNINQKHREFFETYRKESQQKMESLLAKIKSFKMTDEITINQLQLEEYFNQITELKTIIHRSDKILY